MRECQKLAAFQQAMVSFHEQKIDWFSSRLRAA
jgi:hypothetical protein